MYDDGIDHSLCPPGSHDRSLPDDKDQQAVADDGLMGCNDCRRPLFYCEHAGWYFHVDRTAECFLSPSW